MHQFYKVNKHFMSDNFFLYNRQFPSYKPLKSVTVGPGRVGSGRAVSLHISTNLVKTNTFCYQHHMSKMLRFRDAAFLEIPISQVSLLRSLADAHFASLAMSERSETARPDRDAF